MYIHVYTRLLTLILALCKNWSAHAQANIISRLRIDAVAYVPRTFVQWNQQHSCCTWSRRQPGYRFHHSDTGSDHKHLKQMSKGHCVNVKNPYRAVIVASYGSLCWRWLSAPAQNRAEIGTGRNPHHTRSCTGTCLTVCSSVTDVTRAGVAISLTNANAVAKARIRITIIYKNQWRHERHCLIYCWYVV